MSVRKSGIQLVVILSKIEENYDGLNLPPGEGTSTDQGPALTSGRGALPG